MAGGGRTNNQEPGIKIEALVLTPGSWLLQLTELIDQLHATVDL